MKCPSCRLDYPILFSTKMGPVCDHCMEAYRTAQYDEIFKTMMIGVCAFFLAMIALGVVVGLIN